MTSIFSRIIAGELPSYKIYEDDSIFAFLTIQPNKLGHTLVIPKEEIGSILDLSDELMAHLMNMSKNIIAPAIHRATGCVRIGFIVEWFGVPDHAHLHLIPLFQGSDINSSNAHTESAEDMSIIAEKIRSEIV